MGDQHVGWHDMGYGLLGRFTNGNTNAHPNTYSDSNTHAYTDSNANTSSNGHSHINTYSHVHTHPNPDAHSYTNSNPNLYLHTHPNKQGFPCRRRHRRCNGKGLNKHLPMDGNERSWLDHRNVW